MGETEGTLAVPRLRIFSEAHKQAIHTATLQVLERTGVRVAHAGARELLRAAGAQVGGEQRVRIPADLVAQALATAPSRVALGGRRGARDLLLEGWNVHFGTGSDCPNILDWRTGERRAFTSADSVEAMRLCDALPNLDFVMSVLKGRLQEILGG